MNDAERYLVVGGDGLVGRALIQRLAKNGVTAIGTTRRPGSASSNMIHLHLAQNLAKWKPPSNCAVAFLCAAITSQDQCRHDPSGTSEINVTRTAELARILADNGFLVIFLSTNLVFDGVTPAAGGGGRPNPQTEYGRQKARAEAMLQAVPGRVAIVRLGKVVHPGMPLLQKWAMALRGGNTIFPLNDLRCSPIPLDFAAAVLERIGRAKATGVFQVSGDRDLTYGEIARRLARILGADQSLVMPRSHAELGVQLEHLPLHATMDASRLAREFALEPPDVWATLDGVFANLIKS